MPSTSTIVNPERVRGFIRGWVFDVYPTTQGEVAVWVISENGERIRLTDCFEPKIYISGTQEDIERLASRFYSSNIIKSWGFAYKYAHPTDTEKTRVLEVTLKDCRRTAAFTHDILKMGDYLRYEVHNCDLHGDRTYFFDHDIFPLAYVEIENRAGGLRYRLLDSVASTNYSVPPLLVLKLSVEIEKKGKLANFDDPISKITVTQAGTQVAIDSGSEGEKLLQLAEAIRALDPDIVLTSGGGGIIPFSIPHPQGRREQSAGPLHTQPRPHSLRLQDDRQWQNLLLVRTHFLPCIHRAAVRASAHRRVQHLRFKRVRL